MDDSDFLSEIQVGVIGLGLMGGSLALALRGRCAHLLGVDPDPVARFLAEQRRVVDCAYPVDRLLPQVDLIILAAPVSAILGSLQRLPDRFPDSAVVLDLGSTKVEILAKMDELPRRFDPVGGHPMCGKETGGLENADPALFRGAPFALVRLPRSGERAVRMAEAVVQALGAYPVYLDAETHDRWTAATSHAPYLLANALARATPVEARQLIGGGLRSTTRLAPSSLTMMLDILASNRKNVLEALHRVRTGLDEIEAALADADDGRLRILLESGAANYHQLMKTPAEGGE